MTPYISVIIPAHNEEKYIKRCIQSVKKAAAQIPDEVEIIVVCNRCTDREIIVTIDADNRMTKGTLKEVDELLKSGQYIGGGAPIRFERYSFPLWLNDMLCRVSFAITGLYSGIFWAKKETFEAIGGFVDKKAMEDVATAKLLKKQGRSLGKKYTTLRKNYLLNSTRKYDDLGDWLYFKLLVKNAGAFVKAAFGKTEGVDRLLDELFYEYNDRH